MKLLIWIARMSGLVGVLLAVLSVVCRALGMWRLGDVQIGTLLQAAIAAMTLGALAYVAHIAEREPR